MASVTALSFCAQILIHVLIFRTRRVPEKQHFGFFVLFQTLKPVLLLQLCGG
ncbi:hypothetical protein ABMY26_15205 [Azospirillum sp. HJ39]|uniref:hypothetical protein n=1 Tax=Azospirillum sp. HJ39 TaxID=3159496 RepID=UPI003557CECC